MTYLVVFKIYRMRNDEELINLLYTQNMIQNIQKYMSIIRHLVVVVVVVVGTERITRIVPLDHYFIA